MKEITTHELLKLARDLLEAHGFQRAVSSIKAAEQEIPDVPITQALPLGGTWQPIETAPRDGTDILLTSWSRDGYGETDVGSWGFIEKSDADGSDVVGWLSNYGRIEEPTHWMPLPPDPKVKT